MDPRGANVHSTECSTFLLLYNSFVPANDVQLKEYLMNKVDHLRKCRSENESEIRQLQDRLDDATSQLNDTTKKLTTTQSKSVTHEEKLVLAHRSELLNIREQLTNEHTRRLNEMEQKRQEDERSHNDSMDELQRKCDGHLKEYKMVQERLMKLEATATELRTNLEVKSNENKSIRVYVISISFSTAPSVIFIVVCSFIG
jgi:exonuclease VII large subunit